MLNRFRKDSHGIVGTLTYEGSIICYTLENNRLAIPCGHYSLDCTYSPKFGKDLPLILVPHRSGIRIHSGNKQSDSRGCVLVGQLHSNGYQLVNSQITLHSILPFLKHFNSITITNSIEL